MGLGAAVQEPLPAGIARRARDGLVQLCRRSDRVPVERDEQIRLEPRGQLGKMSLGPRRAGPDDRLFRRGSLGRDRPRLTLAGFWIAAGSGLATPFAAGPGGFGAAFLGGLTHRARRARRGLSEAQPGLYRLGQPPLGRLGQYARPEDEEQKQGPGHSGRRRRIFEVRLPLLSARR